MRIEQKQITIIHADEGKVFRRKSDGVIVGVEYNLGYNYFDAGLPLERPHISTPEDFEEVDATAKPLKLENSARRLIQMVSIIERERKSFHKRRLTAKEMIECRSLAPIWGVTIKVGDEVTKGVKFSYQDKLYNVLQDHKVLEYYFPSEDTKHLYEEVTEDYDIAKDRTGEYDMPYLYRGGALEAGKYYEENEELYLCNVATENEEGKPLGELTDYVELLTL